MTTTSFFDPAVGFDAFERVVIMLQGGRGVTKDELKWVRRQLTRIHQYASDMQGNPVDPRRSAAPATSAPATQHASAPSPATTPAKATEPRMGITTRFSTSSQPPTPSEHASAGKATQPSPQLPPPPRLRARPIFHVVESGRDCLTFGSVWAYVSVEKDVPITLDQVAARTKRISNSYLRPLTVLRVSFAAEATDSNDSNDGNAAPCEGEHVKSKAKQYGDDDVVYVGADVPEAQRRKRLSVAAIALFQYLKGLAKQKSEVFTALLPKTLSSGDKTKKSRYRLALEVLEACPLLYVGAEIPVMELCVSAALKALRDVSGEPHLPARALEAACLLQLENIKATLLEQEAVEAMSDYDTILHEQGRLRPKGDPNDPKALKREDLAPNERQVYYGESITSLAYVPDLDQKAQRQRLKDIEAFQLLIKRFLGQYRREYVSLAEGNTHFYFFILRMLTFLRKYRARIMDSSALSLVSAALSGIKQELSIAKAFFEKGIEINQQKHKKSAPNGNTSSTASLPTTAPSNSTAPPPPPSSSSPSSVPLPPHTYDGNSNHRTQPAQEDPFYQQQPLTSGARVRMVLAQRILVDACAILDAIIVNCKMFRFQRKASFATYLRMIATVELETVNSNLEGRAPYHSVDRATRHCSRNGINPQGLSQRDARPLSQQDAKHARRSRQGHVTSTSTSTSTSNSTSTSASARTHAHPHPSQTAAHILARDSQAIEYENTLLSLHRITLLSLGLPPPVEVCKHRERPISPIQEDALLDYLYSVLETQHRDEVRYCLALLLMHPSLSKYRRNAHRTAMQRVPNNTERLLAALSATLFSSRSTLPPPRLPMIHKEEGAATQRHGGSSSEIARQGSLVNLAAFDSSPENASTDFSAPSLENLLYVKDFCVHAQPAHLAPVPTRQIFIVKPKSRSSVSIYKYSADSDIVVSITLANDWPFPLTVSAIALNFNEGWSLHTSTPVDAANVIVINSCSEQQLMLRGRGKICKNAGIAHISLTVNGFPYLIQPSIVQNSLFEISSALPRLSWTFLWPSASSLLPHEQPEQHDGNFITVSIPEPMAGPARSFRILLRNQSSLNVEQLTVSADDDVFTFASQVTGVEYVNGSLPLCKNECVVVTVAMTPRPAALAAAQRAQGRPADDDQGHSGSDAQASLEQPSSQPGDTDDDTATADTVAGDFVVSQTLVQIKYSGGSQQDTYSRCLRMKVKAFHPIAKLLEHHQHQDGATPGNNATENTSKEAHDVPSHRGPSGCGRHQLGPGSRRRLSRPPSLVSFSPCDFHAHFSAEIGQEDGLGAQQRRSHEAIASPLTCPYTQVAHAVHATVENTDPSEAVLIQFGNESVVIGPQRTGCIAVQADEAFLAAITQPPPDPALEASDANANANANATPASLPQRHALHSWFCDQALYKYEGDASARRFRNGNDRTECEQETTAHRCFVDERLLLRYCPPFDVQLTASFMQPVADQATATTAASSHCYEIAVSVRRKALACDSGSDRTKSSLFSLEATAYAFKLVVRECDGTATRTRTRTSRAALCGRVCFQLKPQHDVQVARVGAVVAAGRAPSAEEDFEDIGHKSSEVARASCVLEALLLCREAVTCHADRDRGDHRATRGWVCCGTARLPSPTSTSAGSSN